MFLPCPATGNSLGMFAGMRACVRMAAEWEEFVLHYNIGYYTENPMPCVDVMCHPHSKLAVLASRAYLEHAFPGKFARLDRVYKTMPVAPAPCMLAVAYTLGMMHAHCITDSGNVDPATWDGWSHTFIMRPGVYEEKVFTNNLLFPPCVARREHHYDDD